MILFRVDGNEYIGLGHVMRCLSIADALKKKNVYCLFVLADERCKNLIQQRGYHCSILESRYDDLEIELKNILSVIYEEKPQLVVVDSYYVTTRYLNAIHDIVRTMYIDDIFAFDYPVDILINYNIFCNELDYDELYSTSLSKPTLLMGVEYVPLREDFVNCPQKVQSDSINKIFVSTGGADTEHLTIELLKYIMNNEEKLARFQFHFVIGGANSEKKGIKALSEAIDNVIVHYNVKNMRDLMLSCDIAISAAGSTLYELCACGVPTITYALADNQLLAADCFGKKEIMLYVGDIRNQALRSQMIFNALYGLVGETQKRQRMSSLAQELIGGDGAKKIAEKLVELLPATSCYLH